MFDNVLNAIFAPVLSLNPLVSIFLIGLMISVTVNLINRKALKSEAAKKAKKKMQAIRVEMLEAQKCGDKEKVEKCLNKLMELNSEYLRLMVKPMSISLVISMLLVIIFFPWLNNVYKGVVIARVPEPIPIVGGRNLSWVWWYVASTLIVSLVLKKLLGG